MKRLLLTLAFLTLAGPALADPCGAIPEKGPLPAWAKAGAHVIGSARYFVDGDGLCISASADPATWVEFRIADFYAPEIHAPGGQQAKAALQRIVGSHPVDCTIVRGDHRAIRSYDRLIGVCRVGGVSVGELMRRAGVAEGGKGRR